MHIGVGHDVALVHVDHALKEVALGQKADKSEQAEHPVVGIGFDGGELASLGVFHDHAGEDAVVAADFVHDAVPHEVELFVLERLLLNGLGGTQLVAAVNDRHLAGELREIHGLFDRGVAAADNVDLEVLKERTVARRAEGNTLADELALILAADGTRKRTGGDDDGLGLILALGADELLHVARELDTLDHVAHALHAEMLTLRGHTGDEAGAGIALDLSGIVFDFIGDGDLTAILTLLNDQGAESAAAGIETGGQTRRACAQNDNVINFAHTLYQLSCLWEAGMGRNAPYRSRMIISCQKRSDRRLRW